MELKQRLEAVAKEHNLTLDELKAIRKQILDIGDELICPVCFFITIPLSYEYVCCGHVVEKCPVCPGGNTEMIPRHVKG